MCEDYTALTTAISAFNNNLRCNNYTEWRTFTAVDILSIFTYFILQYNKARSPQPSFNVQTDNGIYWQKMVNRKTNKRSYAY